MFSKAVCCSPICQYYLKLTNSNSCGFMKANMRVQLADDKINVHIHEMMIAYLGYDGKTLLEKWKMLVTSIFPISNNVFISLFCQGHESPALCADL